MRSHNASSSSWLITSTAKVREIAGMPVTCFVHGPWKACITGLKSAVRVRGGDRVFHLVVHPVDDVEPDEPFDDGHAVRVDGRVDHRGVAGGVEPLDVCAHHQTRVGKASRPY